MFTWSDGELLGANANSLKYKTGFIYLKKIMTFFMVFIVTLQSPA